MNARAGRRAGGWELTDTGANGSRAIVLSATEKDCDCEIAGEGREGIFEQDCELRAYNMFKISRNAFLAGKSACGRTARHKKLAIFKNRLLGRGKNACGRILGH